MLHGSLVAQAWDINEPASEADSGRRGPFNILAARHLSQTAQNLPKALAAMYDSIHDNGFIMLQELVGPLGAAVFGHSKEQWQLGDGRAFGPCTSVEHWRRMLATAGFMEITTVKYALPLCGAGLHTLACEDLRCQVRRVQPRSVWRWLAHSAAA